ncbi:hypothetical protein WH50_17970 [Pokkaliibacter plantistimulans]|uniref:Phosphoglycerate mutase n=1 Tax=Pokkaliibacter plantistimulans TaxID=1635171 RepID=A0ABX5LTF8_9GAMM|nr:histidine phosphatase family protein [Pokkaliibacter plantistimulans]PXF29934.1 hypothetical protein WH50_17970 [Pokkaliibacter plantistimulans]
MPLSLPALLARPFVFVRHGETAPNRQGIIAGSTDVPLNAEGEQQARSASVLVSQQHWSVVAVSPMLRARQTASLLLPDASHHLIDDLRERHWGQLEGQPLAALPPYEQTPPGGESWSAFQLRVLQSLNLLLTQYELPLIVAHSGIFRVIRQAISGTPYGERIGNVQPLLIQPDSQGGWQLLSLTPTITTS